MTLGNYSNLYSLMGYGNTTGFFGSSCVYNPFSNASVGWTIGTSVFQTVVPGIFQSISSSSSSKQESDPEKCVQKLDKQISEIVTKLGAEDEDSALRIEPDKKYQDNIDKANSNISTYTAAIKTYDENIATQENIIKAYDSTQQTIFKKGKPTEPAEDASKAKQEKYTADLAAYNQAKELSEAADQAVKDKATLVTEKRTEENYLEKAEAKLEAAEKAQKAEQAKIDKLQNNLKDLIAQRNGYQAKIDSELLNKADGTKLSMSSDKKMEKNYDMDFEKGEISLKEPNGKVKKGDLMNIIHKFRTATEEEKPKLAKMFKTLWDMTFNYQDERTDTLRQAYEQIIMPYLNKANA